MNYYVIIAAGGIGTRMQSATPKQFLQLNSQPIIVHTIAQFIKAIPTVKCIIATPLHLINYTIELLTKYNIIDSCTVIAGGETRFNSVQNCLQTIDKNQEAIVLVQDAARCLVTTNLIKQCIATTIAKGNAVPAIAVTDSLRKVNANGVNEIIDRTLIRSIQTPQVFYNSILQKAFAQTYSPSFTDEASVVEQLGVVINLIEGETTNLKITNPIDIVIAEKILESINQ